jgi:hypothetical protein
MLSQEKTSVPGNHWATLHGVVFDILIEPPPGNAFGHE